MRLLILATTAATAGVAFFALRQRSVTSGAAGSVFDQDWSNVWAWASSNDSSNDADSALSGDGFARDLLTADDGETILSYVRNLGGLLAPRGIRNNNPGNIRKGNDWQGERASQDDAAFEQFTAPEYGIRALGKTLLNYQTRYGLKTLRGIITRWAPTSENDTEAYIAQVAKAVGKPAGVDIDLRADRAAFEALVKAIIKHENGQQPYADSVIRAGIDMALK